MTQVTLIPETPDRQPLELPPRACEAGGRKTVTAAGVGFTLVELLVVIAIIALLIGILLPALGAAKDSAKPKWFNA